MSRKGKKDSLLRGYLLLLLRVALLALVLLLLFSQVFLLTRARGMDMFPAVKDGDLLIAYRLYRDYRKGDVIVYRAEGERRVGRIVAVGGDTVRITGDGALYVRGTLQGGEILFPTEPRDGELQLEVPEDCVFLLGDYRTNSRDSRDFGAVSLSRVDGKVISLLRRRSL